MKEVNITSWKEFVDVCIKKKKLNIQCVNSSSTDSLEVFAVEDFIFWYINLVVEEDIKDLKKNYWKNINKRIDQK